MARLPYKLQKIFANVAADGKLAQFGSLKAGNPTYSDDPDVIQALTYFGSGLGSALINQAPPAIQEFDALFNIMTRQVAYFQQTGIPEWDENTIYYIGCLAQENGIIFMSLVDDNQNNALSDTAKWKLFCNGKTVTVTGYEHVVAYDEEHIRVVNAAPSEDIIIKLPLSSGSSGLDYVGRKISVMSEVPTAASFDVKIYTGDAILVATLTNIYQSLTFIADNSFSGRWKIVLGSFASPYA
jgi:hypothetical protein